MFSFIHLRVRIFPSDPCAMLYKVCIGLLGTTEYGISMTCTP